jgi:hypothetical protein
MTMMFFLLFFPCISHCHLTNEVVIYYCLCLPVSVEHDTYIKNVSDSNFVCTALLHYPDTRERENDRKGTVFKCFIR